MLLVLKRTASMSQMLKLMGKKILTILRPKNLCPKIRIIHFVSIVASVYKLCLTVCLFCPLLGQGSLITIF